MKDSAAHEALGEGALAVISGGASGIGLAAAEAFLDRGMRVCILDANEAALGTVLTADRHAGRVGRFHVDVSDRSQVTEAARTIERDWGPVSVLMNNAGMARGGDVLADPADWERLIGVNLMGVFYGVSAFLPGMMASDLPGIVINTGSKQGITQPPGNTAYNVSKSGVKSLTEGLAHTLREKVGDRIRAHLLVPGFTYTGMMSGHFSEKPSGAWTPAQVVSFMLEAVVRGDFYILCPDNDVSAETDRKRIAWALGDMLENRPALSRWHPDYQEDFNRFMQQ